MAARPDSQARIRAEAAEWMVRLVGDPALKDDPAFRDWLARDPAHARAFSDARLGWEIAAEVGASVRAPVPQRRRFRLPLAAGLGFAAAALAGLWLDTVRPDLLGRMTADHVTAPGPVQALVLPDGSQAVLDGGSALDYAEDAVGRRVTLRGAAYFDVKKDGRSFTVTSGDTQVRVLGTRFALRDCGGCTIVTLVEGRVQVDDTRTGTQTVLAPGQQLRLGADAAPAPVPVDADQALAWREGRFIFYDASLREVAAMLERHGAGRILFADAALAGRPVSGSILLSDPGAELQSLAEAMGFRIIPLPGGKLLL
ncbi:FecR family protein [Paracoccus aminovorans]|uniref:FecR family protein n=1 Tax=Paracoccus aminovorans TaxID=34004 RepID=UPI002B2610FE|nr:FecR domain-containing protein [Paracoccus aminovorans]